MVSIIPQESPSDLVSRIASQGIQQNIPRGMERTGNRAMLQQSLDEVQKLASSGNSNPIDLMLGVMKAGAGIPGSERYIGQILPEIMKFAQAKNSQNVNYPGEQGQQNDSVGLRNREPIQPIQQGQNLPQFGQTEDQASRFFPNNLGGNQSPGNLPQQATEGVVRPILNRSQMIPRSKQLSKELTDNGIATSFQQAMQMVEQENEDNRKFNETVNAETEARKLSQADYGAKAAQQLEKFLPGASPEQIAIVKKEAEEQAGTFKSEADIERAMAKSSEQIANEIEAVKKSLSPPRLHTNISNKILGREKTIDQASEDLRVKLNPLLKRGLYDTARKLTSELGFYPEERENAIQPLTGELKSLVKSIPKVSRPKTLKSFRSRGLGLSPYTEDKYTSQQLNNLNENMQQVFQENPTTNLVLLRKEYEDLGYDWRTIKDALNKNIQSGSIKLNPDQQNQNHYLETPPLNNLEKILHGLNIIGR